MLYYEKMLNASTKASTSHVVDVSDDDFTQISFLEKAADLIKHDNNKNVIFGQIARYEQDFTDHSAWSYETKRIFNEQNTATENLFQFFSCFFSLNHAVIRKEVFLKPFSCVLKNKNLLPIRFFDKIFAFFCLVDGHITILDDLAQLRHHGDRQIDNLQDYPKELEKNLPFNEILNRIQDDNPLARYLSSQRDINLSLADQLIKNIFKNIKYLGHHDLKKKGENA
jgi:hypothetical protein